MAAAPATSLFIEAAHVAVVSFNPCNVSGAMLAKCLVAIAPGLVREAASSFASGNITAASAWLLPGACPLVRPRAAQDVSGIATRMAAAAVQAGHGVSSRLCLDGHQEQHLCPFVRNLHQNGERHLGWADRTEPPTWQRTRLPGRFLLAIDPAEYIRPPGCSTYRGSSWASNTASMMVFP